MSEKARGIVAFLAAVVAAASIATHNVLFVRFSRAGCRVARSDCGIPLNNHGYVSYITPRQWWTLQLLWAAFIAFAVCAAALALSTRLSPKARPG